MTQSSELSSSLIPEQTRPLLKELGLEIQGKFVVYDTYQTIFWEREPRRVPPETLAQDSKTPLPTTRLKSSHKIPYQEWTKWSQEHKNTNQFKEFLNLYLAEVETKATAKADKIQSQIHRILELTTEPTCLRYVKGQDRGSQDPVPKDIMDIVAKGYPTDLVGEEVWNLKTVLNRVEVIWQKIRSLISQGQVDELTAKLAGHQDFQIKKRSLRQKFTIEIPVGSAVMSLKNEVISQLSSQDLERFIILNPQELTQALQNEFRAPVETMKASINEQVQKLLKKIRKLPHADLLPDQVIADTLKPYFTRQEDPFRKRHARDALVAVEEKAREAKYRDDVFRLEEHRAEYADVARYYPIARQLQRKLVLYVGPTNSGKTWRALNDLAEGASGAYLAPLRLLALEGQEELEKRGKTTSYVTGEEREIRPDAAFVSSTIEMMDFDRIVDRIVIDEVQLLADERRGWAWLAAFVGAPASRLIMTGSPDCIAIVRWLASYLNEELEIVECQRYNELRVADVPTQLHQLPPATAVVCFSRRDVLLIKSQIEETSQHRVAVVYGNLSPQVRREEARRFRSGEADILVATDAIAMGLNLPIHQVVFFKTEKFDGESTRPLTFSEIRQIGGRAGRYGFAQFGVVSALTPQALNQVRFAIRSPQKPIEPTYYVAPGPNHIRIIGKVLGSDSLERILTFFEKAMDFSNPCFARANIDELSFLSSAIDQALPSFTPVERLGIACAPVDLKSETVLSWFLDRMVPAFGAVNADGFPEDTLEDLFSAADEFSHGAASGSMELRRAEDYLKTLTVYAWLAYRYPQTFPHIDNCQEKREVVNSFIERSLRAGVVRRCTGCKKKLPAIHPYRQCEECFHKSRKTRFEFSGESRSRKRR